MSIAEGMFQAPVGSLCRKWQHYVPARAMLAALLPPSRPCRETIDTLHGTALDRRGSYGSAGYAMERSGRVPQGGSLIRRLLRSATLAPVLRTLRRILI